MRTPSGRPRDGDDRGSCVLRCRRAREHYPCVSTGSAAEGVGDAPLASPGARWTGEEDEELVAAVRAGADLAMIAEQHGRTRSAIVSRLLRMIPQFRVQRRDRAGGVIHEYRLVA